MRFACACTVSSATQVTGSGLPGTLLDGINSSLNSWREDLIARAASGLELGAGAKCSGGAANGCVECIVVHG